MQNPRMQVLRLVFCALIYSASFAAFLTEKNAESIMQNVPVAKKTGRGIYS